jgi:hypothetical protein
LARQLGILKHLGLCVQIRKIEDISRRRKPVQCFHLQHYTAFTSRLAMAASVRWQRGGWDLATGGFRLTLIELS